MLAPIFASLTGAAPSERLEARLVALWEEGRAAWPSVNLDAADFARDLAARAVAAGTGERALDGLHAADLYLACACARGVAGAAAAFERRFLSEVPGYLRRLRPAPALVDEVRAVLGERLFVGEGGAAPKIAGYSGAGPLSGWLRVAAVRTALNLTRRKGDAIPAGEPVAAAIADGDPETELLRARYGAAMSEAVRAAFATLGARQRSVLRLRFADGLTDEKIAALFGVHQTTVSRWITAAREAVLVETHRRLREALRLDARELQSLAGILRSRIDLSLDGLLGSGDGSRG